MLHARGDVSGTDNEIVISRSYAPRTWRCFHLMQSYLQIRKVCSTHVEMFLTTRQIPPEKLCMLHARGDVSTGIRSRSSLPTYAPRTWRCFLLSIRKGIKCHVCSTHVEMFPTCRSKRLNRRRMLHARGDVSLRLSPVQLFHQYAPRTWRCFQRVVDYSQSPLVCSTHVEFFLSSLRAYFAQ